MSGWLTGLLWGQSQHGPQPGPTAVPQPQPVIHNQPSNPFYSDIEDHEKMRSDEDGEEDDADYNPQRMKTEHTQQIYPYVIVGETPLLEKYNAVRNTQYLNMGSIPLKQSEINALSFNLNHTTTVKHFFIQMPNGEYYAVKCSYDFHSKVDSDRMDQEDNPSNYEELDEISYGAFTESAVQYKMDTRPQRKYLVVRVYKTNKHGQVMSDYNYKKLELQEGVIENARRENRPGVDVYIKKQFIKTLLQKEPNASVQEQVPEFYEEKVERHIETTRKARQTYSEATRSGLELQAKLRAYHAFYDTLFITTKPNPATDERKIDNMSYIELKNYIEKLHHIVVNSQLDYKKKDDIKAYLKDLHEKPNIKKIVGLKLKLTSLLRDIKLIDLMGIKNEVPIIDKLYFNDKVWMNHYHAGMAASYLMNKEQLDLTFTKLIEPEIQNIKDIIDDRTGVSPEKLSSINESLQKIKRAFLPKLMDLLKAIQSLVKNHPFTRRHVIIDLDNLTELEQALDRLTQLLASSKLSKNQELTALTHADDFEGGSRVKNKKKTRKRTKKRNKKRNKSKRHKGYSRR